MKAILILTFFTISSLTFFQSNGQATVAGALGTPNFNTGIEFVGFTNSLGPLMLQNGGSTYIQLETSGMVGIGTAAIPATLQLEVSSEINIVSPANYYMIGGSTVLHNYGTNNLFTGVSAGNFSLTGTLNTAVGVLSGNSLTSGSSNSFLGYAAGKANSQYAGNTYIGSLAGQINQGSENVMIGASAGGSATATNSDCFIGVSSGYNNSGGINNVFVGHSSGKANTTANSNTFLGFETGLLNTEGEYNVFIGSEAGKNNIGSSPPSLSTGLANVFIGKDCGLWNQYGSYNTFTGFSAGLFTGNSGSRANENCFYGKNSGYKNVDGNRNSFYGTESGEENLTDSNAYFGAYSGHQNRTGTRNAFLGTSAGYNNTKDDNTFLGHQAGFTNITGVSNTFVGMRAGMYNTASDNSFLGFFSGLNNSSGTRNTFSGANSGQLNTTGNDNTFIGYFAGNANTSSRNNTHVGSRAGVLSTGFSNTLIGKDAGAANSSGNQNVFVGHSSGAANTTASFGVIIGYNAGSANTTGTNNTFIGNSSAPSNTTGSYNTVVGNAADCSATFDHQVAIGDGAVAQRPARDIRFLWIVIFNNKVFNTCNFSAFFYDLSINPRPMPRIFLRHILFFLLLLDLSMKAGGQNLVPNPSFEDTLSCPNGPAQITKATGWMSFRNTPDYFNKCNNTGYGIPINSAGYQNSKSGNAYAGISNALNGSNLREFIGIELTQHLDSGVKYWVSFYVCRASNIGINKSINKIGARFSSVPFSNSNPQQIDNYSQIFTDSIISDTVNWTNVRGSFIADSNYNYVAFGDFFNDSLTSFFSDDTLSGVAYYFIDEICVSQDSSECSSIVSVNENININPDLFNSIYNPSLKTFYVNNKSGALAQLEIYNCIGQLLIQRKLLVDENMIPYESIKNGLYLILIRQKTQVFIKKIIIYSIYK